MAAPDRLPPDAREDEPPEPPRLRALRLMVTALTVTLILGVVAIAAALVIRVTRAEPAPSAPAFDAGALRAEAFALPEGAKIVSVGGAGDVVLFVLRAADGAETLRAHDAETGALRHEAQIRRPAQ